MARLSALSSFAAEWKPLAVHFYVFTPWKKKKDRVCYYEWLWDKLVFWSHDISVTHWWHAKYVDLPDENELLGVAVFDWIRFDIFSAVILRLCVSSAAGSSRTLTFSLFLAVLVYMFGFACWFLATCCKNNPMWCFSWRLIYFPAS